MVPCVHHPETYHVPSHRCVSCVAVDQARERAGRDAAAHRERQRQADDELRAREELGVTNAKKEEKKAKKAEEREKEREKREKREKGGFNGGGKKEKKLHKFGKGK